MKFTNETQILVKQQSKELNNVFINFHRTQNIDTTLFDL